jgi:hypothetical protein
MALLPGSPARNNSVGSPFTTDQRGFVTIGTPDLGAYEAGSSLVTYAAWAYETLPPGADYSFTADFENDGRQNGLEYATFTNPLASTGGTIPTLTLNTARTFAFIQFPYRFEGTDVNYEVERSTDLVTWTKVVEIDRSGIVYEGPGILYFSEDATSITYSDSFINGQDKVFYQLSARAAAVPLIHPPPHHDWPSALSVALCWGIANFGPACSPASFASTRAAILPSLATKVLRAGAGR